MKLTVLVENQNNDDMHLAGEHGLSIFIEYGRHRILLDAGTTGLFAQNALRLHKDLASVDMAVLSHAHYDHSGGFEQFFDINKKAKLYLQASCRENCWRIPGRLRLGRLPEPDGLTEDQLKYIGLPHGFTRIWENRLCPVAGDASLADGIWLIAHHTEKLWETGQAAGMCRREKGGFVYDDFDHEQTLVLEGRRGLILLNSCCHSGPETVIREITGCPRFAGKNVFALIGGFHLKDVTMDGQGSERLDRVGRQLLHTGVPYFYTGHCTGEAAFARLKTHLGSRLCPLKTGDCLQFEDP